MKRSVLMFLLVSLGLSAHAQEALIIKTSGDSVRSKIAAVSKDFIFTKAGNIKASEVQKVVLSSNDDNEGLLATVFQGRIEINPNILSLQNTEPQSRTPSFEDWKIEEKEAIWRKVYTVDGDSTMLATELLRQLKSLSFVELDMPNGGINGKLVSWTIDYKKYGRKYMTTPFMFSRGKWSGSIVAEFKQGRYRVTVSNLYLDLGKVNVNTYGRVGMGVSQDMTSSWSETLLTKNREEFRSARLADATFLSEVLTDIFQLKQIKKKDDW